MKPDNIDWLLCSAAVDASKLDVAKRCNADFPRWTHKLRLVLLCLMPVALMLVVVITNSLVSGTGDTGHLANWTVPYSELNGSINQLFVKL